MERFIHSHAQWFRGIGRRNLEGLENFCTGRDRRELAKTLSHLGPVEGLTGPSREETMPQSWPI
jgi:hypothetical protein